MAKITKLMSRSKEVVYLPNYDSFDANECIQDMIDDICENDNCGHLFKGDSIRVKIIVDVCEDK